MISTYLCINKINTLRIMPKTQKKICKCRKKYLVIDYILKQSHVRKMVSVFYFLNVRFDF